MLKGNQVVLRHIKKSDLALFIKWFNDPEIIQYLTQCRPLTEVEEEMWMNRIITNRKEHDIVFVVENEKNNIIGSCGFHKINHKDRNAEISFVVGEKEHWGKGHGADIVKVLLNYGFNQLNFKRIATGAYDFNKRSIKVLQKSGFKKEGCLRKAIFKNGGYHDIILFSILYEEWENNATR